MDLLAELLWRTIATERIQHDGEVMRIGASSTLHHQGGGTQISEDALRISQTLPCSGKRSSDRRDDVADEEDMATVNPCISPSLIKSLTRLKSSALHLLECMIFDLHLSPWTSRSITTRQWLLSVLLLETKQFHEMHFELLTQ